MKSFLEKHLGSIEGTDFVSGKRIDIGKTFFFYGFF